MSKKQNSLPEIRMNEKHRNFFNNLFFTKSNSLGCGILFHSSAYHVNGNQSAGAGELRNNHVL